MVDKDEVKRLNEKKKQQEALQKAKGANETILEEEENLESD